ncbi:hypothetical protein L2E82_34676 [Cichorium intybus]|uniref:Uncharacterized protein n=1 Tax=Cichorium intybus TaxID=13427 RepID=A0ACB9BMJ1_CICIN|nr:hypothetical protein L2E82_34676 [Cichorium intybus]
MAVVGSGRMGFMIDGISSLPPKLMVELSLAGFNLKGKDEAEVLELKRKKGMKRETVGTNVLLRPELSSRFIYFNRGEVIYDYCWYPYMSASVNENYLYLQIWSPCVYNHHKGSPYSSLGYYHRTEYLLDTASPLEDLIFIALVKTLNNIQPFKETSKDNQKMTLLPSASILQRWKQREAE